MSDASSDQLRILVDVSGSAATQKAALEAVAELSFQHRHYFRIFGDTHQVSQHLSLIPYEAEFVETVHCESPAAALSIAAASLCDGLLSMFVSSQNSRTVSSALAAAGCLLPSVRIPALTAIVPAVKSMEPGDRDRYSILLDIEGHAWPTPNDAATLIALARPLVAWFHSGLRVRVGVLSIGDGVALSPAQQSLLSSLDTLPTPLVSVGALTPTQVMLGEADLVLNVGEGGAMFVRTLESTFVAAEALVHRETQGVRGRLGLRIFRDRLEKLRDYGNIESYGGSPLLGVHRPCVVLRPEAGTRAWMNAFRTVAKMEQQKLIPQQRLLLSDGAQGSS